MPTAAACTGTALLGEQIAAICTETLQGEWRLSSDTLLVDQLRTICFRVLMALLPCFAICIAVTILAELLQIGVLFAPSKLAPDFRRISPTHGLQRYAEGKYWSMIAGMLLKGIAILAIGCWAFWSERNGIVSLAIQREELLLPAAVSTLARTGLKLFGGLLVIGVIDFGVRRWLYERALRNSAKNRQRESRTTRATSIVDTHRRQFRQETQINAWRDARGGSSAKSGPSV